MKILFFIGELTEGGAERVISILANKLVEKDFEVEILKYYSGEVFYTINNKVKITCVEDNTNKKSKLKNYSWIRNYFKNNCDIIISFLAVFNIYALLANLGNKPIIVADRNDPRFVPGNTILRIIRNIMYRFSNVIVLQTENNKKYFSKYIQSKSVVIYNPIDLKEKKGLALKTKKENIIVSVGRTEKQKNQELLIDAFKEISKKYDDYKLVIYGDGSYMNQLKDKVKTLNLKDKVLLPGQESDVFNKISKANIFVLSSNYEGMPNALVEAMCLGLPCISTKVSGANELIQDNENSYLIDIGNKEQLIEKLEILINDSNKRNEFANKAVKLNDKLSVDVIAKQWIELINNI